MTPEMQQRIKEAREKACDEFWASVVKSFPEATSGDFDFGLDLRMTQAMDNWIELWLEWNSNLLTPKVDSKAWFQAIADELVERGWNADINWMGGGIICVFVHLPSGYSLCWGTANETWGADVWKGDEFLDGESVTSDFPCETEDPKACANAIEKATQIFAAKKSPAKSDREDEALTIQVARTFASFLKQTVTAENWDEMRRRNQQEKSEGVCHSHDFTDANLLMSAAISEVLGRECDVEKDTALWNGAWEFAMEQYLS